MRTVLFLLVLLGGWGTQAETPWLRHRISRNWRTPINRPPLNHDELLDDVDYYPDGYLAEMARDGVNGLWVSAELEELSGSEKRLGKLKATVGKAARHGIGIWLMMNDPVAPRADSPIVRAHPDWFGPGPKWDEGMRLWCPSCSNVLQYVKTRVAQVFRAVPGLAGVINISHGEGMTTCLSNLSGRDVDYEDGVFCPRCAKRAPWQLHADMAAAFVAGMREGNPKAELLAWAYQSAGTPERRAWVPELARHQPAGSTLVYNFESGCVKDQLGRRHVGGDYWLSVAGPGAPFATVAAAAREAHMPIAAKIQVATSHEMATLPYVPAPGLLYRKYRAMRAAGVTSVLQCWFFGNMPGVMNKAAGWLASVDFDREDEKAFLRRLAADDWGADAPALERIWSAFTAAYEDYPLDNSMQYYGPFAAGVAWPLSVRPELKPLARTWIPTDAVSGDFIGECLKDFTLDEAETLTARMAARCESVRANLDALAAKYADNPARTKDIGVMKAFHNQVIAAHDIFAFYKARRDGDCAAMVRIAADELKLTDEMIALATADERLGWHSEAEARLYSPELLRARKASLEEVVRTGAAVPERRGCDATFGREIAGSNIVWTATMDGADCVIRGTVRNVPGLVVSATDEFGTVYPKTRHLAVTNGSFEVRLERFRPGRLLFLADTYPQRLHAEVLWPQGKPKVLNRLRLPWSHGPSFGVIGH